MSVRKLVSKGLNNGTAVTNIITSGNFAADSNADGVADNWVKGGNIVGISVSNNEQSFTGAGTITSSSNNWFRQDVANFENFVNKIYLVVSAKRNNSFGSNRLQAANGYHSKAYFALTTNFSTYSAIFIPDNITQIQQDKLVFGADSGVEVTIKEVLAIDLTAKFGSGNEPSLVDCNNLFFQWFDGTTIVRPNFSINSPLRII